MDHTTPTMRLLIFACALATGLGMTLDTFHNFNLEHSKTYKSSQEYELRRSIFMNNYNKMLEHNKRYEAGEVTWSQGVHPDISSSSPSRSCQWPWGRYTLPPTWTRC